MIWTASLQSTSLEFIPQSVQCYLEYIVPIPKTFTYFELVTIAVPLALALGYCQSSGASIFQNWLHTVNVLTWLALFGHRILEWSRFKFELATICMVVTFCSCFIATASKEQKVQKKRTQRRKLYEQLDRVDEEYSDHGEEEDVEVSNSPTPAATPASTPMPPTTPISTPMPPPSPAPGMFLNFSVVIER